MTDTFQEDDEDIIKIHKEGQAVVATLLLSEITMFSLAEMRHALAEVVTEKPELLILDVSKTNYLDSSGIAIIFKLRHQIMGYGGRFCIAGLTGRLLNVLEKILKKDDVVFYEDLDTALTTENR